MKVKDYIKKGDYPVGKGWQKLVDKLCKDIAKIDPDTEVSQIKEKFGTLRFYHQGGQEVARLAEKAEQKSAFICEVCGKKDNGRAGRFYSLWFYR